MNIFVWKTIIFSKTQKYDVHEFNQAEWIFSTASQIFAFKKKID